MMEFRRLGLVSSLVFISGWQLCLAAVTVTIDPPSATVRAGKSRKFTATIAGNANGAVTWTVNGVTGGNASVGTVNTSGNYTSPAIIPASNVVTVKATSTASASDAPAGSATSALVTLQNPVPVLSGVAPYAVNTGLAFQLTVTGNYFVSGATVLLNGTALPTTFVSATQLTARGISTAAAGTLLAITVSNPDPGAAVSVATRTVKVTPPVGVTLSPSTLRQVRVAGGTQQYSFYVSNTSDKTLVWSVNGVAGGNAASGTITAAGLYTSPLVAPAPNTVTTKAVSVFDPTATASVSVALLNPVPAVTTTAPASLKIGEALIDVSGSGFVNGSQVMLGATVVPASFVSPTLLRAKGTVPAAIGGVIALRVSNPEPGASLSNAAVIPVGPANPQMTAADAASFLEQATWGPGPDSIAHVQQVGKAAYLTEQFAAPVSTFSDPPPDMNSLSPAQQRFFKNAMSGPDQLRQRVAFTLAQIFVVSGLKVGNAYQMVPYLRLMQDNAFGNYYDLMRAVTLSPTMGRYLDMVNNDKPDPAKGIAANENYARELMQLFTLGTVTLNQDGSMLSPAAPYDEAAVKTFGRSYTGWTYPTMPGATLKKHNPSYYAGPMEALDSNHDMEAKTLLSGVVVAGGRTAVEDLDAALKNIFAHPNVGPFVTRRLIQHLVTSNPSPGYISRVAGVFNNNGSGVKGDLKAVVRAILLDTEAAAAPANTGHLREPVLYTIAPLRALGANVADENSLPYQASQMGQNLFYSPSVFNYFSPNYRAGKTGLFGPEFQLMTPSTAILRDNFAYRVARNGLGTSAAIDLTPLETLAANPADLVDALNAALLHGQMAADMRASILTAMAVSTDNRARARTALYLVLSSSQYQVQH